MASFTYMRSQHTRSNPKSNPKSKRVSIPVVTVSESGWSESRGDSHLKRTGTVLRLPHQAGALALLTVSLGVSLVTVAFATPGGQNAAKPPTKNAPNTTGKDPAKDTTKDSTKDSAKDGQSVTPQQAEFFESRVRPLLFNSCFGCHNDKSHQGGLRLDSLDAMLKGGGGGPALVPSDVEKSHIIAAVRYTGALKMPPTGKLKDEEIATLTEWVKMGAPWPGARVSSAALAAQKGELYIADAQKSHWAFQPVKNSPLPPVKNMAWVHNPIDRFVLAKLEAKGLKPAPVADRRTLIRRASFDLIGLPPTPEEIDAFVNDKSPNAWEKVVDRLLESPRYGERWARHWLDVARYADTKGYVFVEDAVFHNAYTYRDYVIDAFNHDMRYDKFVIEQLAADLAYPDDRSAQAACGFITLGRRFLNDRQLQNDDRIDTTCRGMMALTVACARCHDHKFDPIATKDYYSLYSVFNRSDEATVPISPVEKSRPYEEYQAKVAKAEADRDNIVRPQMTRLRSIVMKTPDQITPPLRATLQSIRTEALPNPDQLNQLLPLFESDARDKINFLRSQIATLNKNVPPMPEFGMALRENGNNEEQRVFVRGNQGNRGDLVPRKFLTILSQNDPKPYPATGSGRLELARYIASADNPLTGRVFVNRVWLHHFGQGIVRTPSDFGMRGEKPTHPELLDWLAYQFTREPEDGPNGAPTRATAYACGWSIKKLHKLILTSSTYQMNSDAPSLDVKRAFAIDSENRLLWRQNRQRLDLESLRDSLLFASGKLDTSKIGGPAVELTTMPYTTRRTIYGFVNRNNLQGLFRTFDFATPDQSAAQRINTSIPQQSLFLMNSPFVVEQAQALAKLPELNGEQKQEADRIKTLYRRLFGRLPSADELAMGTTFLHQPAPETIETKAAVSPWQYGWGEYDMKVGHVLSFTPFAHFTGQVWQAGPVLPDPKLDFLSLTADGGHPGRDLQHTVIRRWVSPLTGVISIDGTLNHPESHGDGVRGHVVSSRLGALGEWPVFHKSVPTQVATVQVKKGDILDFVVDCNKEMGFDTFQWTLNLKVVTKGVKLIVADPTTPQAWTSMTEFSGPNAQPSSTGLSNWERYVQTLLMTNEFNFVD